MNNFFNGECYKQNNKEQFIKTNGKRFKSLLPNFKIWYLIKGFRFSTELCCVVFNSS